MNSTHQEPSKTDPEPAWIRDSQIARVEFDEALNARGFDWIGEICEGALVHCEHCGAPFAMWPTKAFADHTLTEHGAALTIQGRTGMAQLCADVPNESQSTYFAIFFAQRVELRRRAWKLGYARAEASLSDRPRLVS